MFRLKQLDFVLIAIVLVIGAIGIVAVNSASVSIASKNYNNGAFFFNRHLIYWAIGIIACLTAFLIKTEYWEKFSKPLFILGVIGLILVFVPGLGLEINYSKRWIGIAGFTIQPSEFMKFGWLMYLSAYVAKHQQNLNDGWKSFSRPMFLLGFVIIALLLQPDFGSSVVMLAMTMAILFLAGAHLLQFIYVVVIAIASMAAMLFTEVYRQLRMTSFLDPWADEFGSGYQLVQSLIAFGRGEVTGVGIGESIQKHLYLPEAHTDFVYAIWAEETGLIGNLLLILLFALLVWRLFAIGKKAESLGWFFKAHVVYGVALFIALQAMVNIGVCMGLLPTKGLTLPFVSYGGSSLLVMSAMVGVVLRIQADMMTAKQQVEGAYV